MKRFFAALLILTMVLSVALAEGVPSVNDYVERQGYKPASVKNKSGLVGCWFVEDDKADTLQWSDKSRIYTISDRKSTRLNSSHPTTSRMPSSA